MKSPYVSELQPNQIVTANFLVQHKDIRQKKTGEPYLSLMLGDRTGEIEAKMWDNAAEVIDVFERDDFLRVRGLLQVHQNRLQLSIHKLQKLEHQSIDFTDFFPASSRGTDEMWSELQTIIHGVGNEHLRSLLLAVTGDADVEQRFKIAPAAKNIHHAFLGGLLEHVLSLCNLAKLTASHYKDIDLDLLLTGAILHDIGKIYELTYDRSFGYSTDGQLLGHIFIGLRLIDEKIRDQAGFPGTLRRLLEHMVISHHGQLDFGSPKVPLFPEALLLHHLDNLDSKMECMRAFIEKDKQVDGCWTSYCSSLERSVLKKRKYLDESLVKTQTPAQVSAAVAGNGSVSPVPAGTAAPPNAAAAQPAYRPNPSSAFADKLKSALQS